MCGESLHLGGTCNNTGGLENVTVAGNYDSEYLSDCTLYKFSFCEKCLANLLLKCKIEPCIGTYGPGNGIQDFSQEQFSFEDNQRYLKWRRWEAESYKTKESDHYKHFLNNKCTNAYKCNNKAKYLVDYAGNYRQDSSYVQTWTSCEKHKKLNSQHFYSEYQSEAQQLKKIVFK